ncbi:MAG: hypothetical protein IJM27_01235 [Eubacterium sp.]|nr:hypothetical protein [Eubacterium sp.]
MNEKDSLINLSEKKKEYNDSERNAWHPAFYGGIELDFREDREDITFENEHHLSKEPLRIDVLIIKKNKETVLKNQIGKIFRKYNIIEFKSPRDQLSIDDFFKAIGYAYIYKALGETVNAIPLEELTVSFVRYSYPRGLIKALSKYGGIVEEVYPGVFYISGVVPIPIQMIVTKWLSEYEHAELRLLSPRVTEEDVRRFLDVAKEYSTQGDYYNANAVLQVSSNVNAELFEEVWRDKTMCESLMKIMKEEVDRRCDAAADREIKSCIANLMKNMHLSAEEAMDVLEIPEEKRESLLV